MLITLSTPTFDPLGFVQIHALPSSDTKSITRRVSRVATLDGGVAVNDFGFSDGDRVLSIVFRPSHDQIKQINRIMRAYSRVHISAQDGFYLSALQSMRVESLQSTLTALLLSRLD